MFIDWFTVLAQVINFLVLVALLKRFLYKPVLDAIDRREHRIAAQLEDARTTKQHALQQRAEFERKNIELDSQRAALLKQATDAANRERASMLDAARREHDELRARFQSILREEQELVAHEIVARAEEAAVAIARQALHDLAGESMEDRIAAVLAQRLRDAHNDGNGSVEAWAKAAQQPLVVRSAFELSATARSTIEQALRQAGAPTAPLRFELANHLIGGIEIAGNGAKLTWSFAEYLDSLEERVRTALSEVPISHG